MSYPYNPCGEFFVYSSVSHEIGVPLLLGNLCTFLASFSHLLVQPQNDAIPMTSSNLYTPFVGFSYILAFLMEFVYRCSLMIRGRLWCFFARSGAFSEYSNTNDIVYLVHPFGWFSVYSSVSHGIGVPLFLGDWCTSLACFSHLLAQRRNIAILMIMSNLYTPLVSYSYILAFFME